MDLAERGGVEWVSKFYPVKGSSLNHQHPTLSRLCAQPTTKPLAPPLSAAAFARGGNCAALTAGLNRSCIVISPRPAKPQSWLLTSHLPTIHPDQNRRETGIP